MLTGKVDHTKMGAVKYLLQRQAQRHTKGGRAATQRTAAHALAVLPFVGVRCVVPDADEATAQEVGQDTLCAFW